MILEVSWNGLWTLSLGSPNYWSRLLARVYSGPYLTHTYTRYYTFFKDFKVGLGYTLVSTAQCTLGELVLSVIERGEPTATLHIIFSVIFSGILCHYGKLVG